MEDFTYVQPAVRVLFGSGTITKLPAELHRQHLKKPLLLCPTRRQSELTSILSDNGHSATSDTPTVSMPITPSGVFTGAKMHTPVDVTEKCIEYMRAVTPDCIVSVGGGSTIGLGKAVSYRTGLPHIAVPTTYSGSEMTASLGETVDGRKVHKVDEKIRPGTVIYDVDLTLSLPINLTGSSGINAVAHAAEALWASNRNPVVRIMAIEGIKSVFVALAALAKSPDGVEMRKKALYGAYLCGACLGSGVKMGIQHKLAHTLGGSFDMPHSETHTALLRQTFAWNLKYVHPDDVEKLEELKGVVGVDSVEGLIAGLVDKVGAERSLEKLGLERKDVGEAVRIAMEAIGGLQGNGVYLMGKGVEEPREYTEEDVRGILERAFEGATVV